MKRRVASRQVVHETRSVRRCLQGIVSWVLRIGYVDATTASHLLLVIDVECQVPLMVIGLRELKAVANTHIAITKRVVVS